MIFIRISILIFLSVLGICFTNDSEPKISNKKYQHVSSETKHPDKMMNFIFGSTGKYRKNMSPPNRKLANGCVKIGSEDDCFDCLNSTAIDRRHGWCAKPSFCFDATTVVNYQACRSVCNGDIFISDDPDIQGECDSLRISVAAVVLLFILAVLCPVCIIASCVFFCCYRCRNALHNKIAVGTVDDDGQYQLETNNPVPVLQVHNGGHSLLSSYPMSIAEVTIQDSNVINLDRVAVVAVESNGGSQKGSYAQVDTVYIQPTGTINHNSNNQSSNSSVANTNYNTHYNTVNNTNNNTNLNTNLNTNYNSNNSSIHTHGTSNNNNNNNISSNINFTNIIGNNQQSNQNYSIISANNNNNTSMYNNNVVNNNAPSYRHNYSNNGVNASDVAGARFYAGGSNSNSDSNYR